ncbi:MAG TPA: VIT1/CCC1 transporter family protein [Cellulomonas sp.]|nr:VIT1/CCC1 transporter family protein [Cellulomonas sp.]
MTTQMIPDLGPARMVIDGASAMRLNWLRAAVLGANDGIVSIAALVVGVAAASSSLSAIAISGVAGLVAGALSMASGEYVSVSSQRDAERVLIQRAKQDGGSGEHHLTNAWHAAGASLGAFVVGGIIPLVAVLATPAAARVLATFVAVVVALTLTGYVSARLGGAPVARAMARNVVGGGLAMVITYGVGNLVGLAF